MFTATEYETLEKQLQNLKLQRDRVQIDIEGVRAQLRRMKKIGISPQDPRIDPRFVDPGTPEPIDPSVPEFLRPQKKP